MMIPDPRLWREAADGARLQQLALKSLAGDVAARAALRLELDALVDSDDAAVVQSLLRDAPSAACYRHLQQMVAKLINKPARGETVIARLFAIPLVMVAGAKKTMEVPAALPDIAAVTALFEAHGVLGAGCNFGLGNALCAMETLDGLRPHLLRQWAAQLRGGGSPLELAGTTVTVAPGREQVYLRFLFGATVAPAYLPAVTETGSNVGAWGIPLTRLLAQQFAQPGLDLLPIPRAPVALYLASDAGRAAQIELAFSLFLSNAVRQFRMAVGDPTVVLSAHRLEDGAAEIRVSLSSAFDESLLEGFRCPLYPTDNLDEITIKINELCDECRLGDRHTLATVAADSNSRGGRFVAAGDVEQVEAAARVH